MTDALNKLERENINRANSSNVNKIESEERWKN